MKKAILTLVFGALGLGAFAQDAAVEKTSPFTAGVDLYNVYVWRGKQFGDGPSIQPTIKFTKGGFTIGAWGAFGIADSYKETDLFASYTLPFGLTVGVTDYYYPGYDAELSEYYGKDVKSDVFEYGDEVSSHAVEVNLAYTIKGLTVAGNYIVNNSSIGAGSYGDDMYFEAAYAFKYASIFVGGGNGWHTTDMKYDLNKYNSDDFQVVNVGIKTTKTIKVTPTFEIPVTGSLVVNPNEKQMYAVVGLSF